MALLNISASKSGETEARVQFSKQHGNTCPCAQPANSVYAPCHPDNILRSIQHKKFIFFKTLHQKQHGAYTQTVSGNLTTEVSFLYREFNL